MLAVLASAALGGLAAVLLVEAVWGTGVRRLQEVVLNLRIAGMMAILSGLFWGVCASLVLLAADARGRAPRTWWGWSMAGFLAGGLMTAPLCWLYTSRG